MPNEDGSETLSEKIERVKRERDPQGAAGDSKDAAAQPLGQEGGQARGSDGTGATTTKSGDKASAQLGEATTKTTDGPVDGERIRARTASLVPESNDVMLGDQSSRLKPSEKGPLAIDGSKSPHDDSSEGGSRQGAALEQVGAAKDATAEAKKDPAFQADAKQRTI